MMGDVSSFAFTISLAAVINGLGLVRLMTTLAEYVKGHYKLQITHYWLYILLLGIQFLMHILLWWAMFGTRAAGTLNFLQYLYLLIGPVLLYLSTSLLLPDTDAGTYDMRELYQQLARPYFTVVALFWLWTCFLWKTLVGVFPPPVPFLAAFVLVTVVARFSSTGKVHPFVVSLYGIMILMFIALYQIELGGIAQDVVNSLEQQQ